MSEARAADPDTPLNHVVSGSGAPALVFVHGLACSLDDWDAQLRDLAPRHRCIAVDLPGHGASAAPGPLAIMRFGQRVNDSVRALGATPVVLVGHSMGCRVVLEAARHLGDGVAALVLIDGSLRGTGDARGAREQTRATIRAAGFAPYVSGLFTAMFTPASDAATRERIVERALRLDPEAGTELIADLSAWDAAELDGALAAVRVPLLVIQSTGVDSKRNRVPLRPGESTPWVDRVRERVSGARVEIVPGVGHFTMLEAAARVSGLVAEFAAAVSPR